MNLFRNIFFSAVITLLCSISYYAQASSENLSAIKGIVSKVKLIAEDNYLAYLKMSDERVVVVSMIKKDLKYPESFVLFKKGEKVIAKGTYISQERFHANQFSFGVSMKEFDEIVHSNYFLDSIKIENIVEFYTYEDDSIPSSSAVRFFLRVTNLSNRFIPALNPSNNGITLNADPYQSVTEFYVNEQRRGLSIYNGIAFEYEVINKNNVSETQEGWVLDPNSAIMQNENIISIQWKYMGLTSEVIKVDLKNKRVL